MQLLSDNGAVLVSLQSSDKVVVDVDAGPVVISNELDLNFAWNKNLTDSNLLFLLNFFCSGSENVDRI